MTAKHDISRKDVPMLWQRGSLTPDQVRLVMPSLPCDVSYADEHDVLRFWSGEGYKTCDARFIGRDVRDCHPEGSLDVLETILRAFKDGTRDTAESWGHEKGRFEYVRYTAVRDPDGAYKGIVEVIMDLSAFRALQGTQEMPGW